MIKVLESAKRNFKEARTLLVFSSIGTLSQGLGAILPLIIAKSFAPETFGKFSLARMTIFFFLAIAISSTRSPFIVFAGKERTARHKINRTFTVQLLFVALTIIAVAAIFTVWQNSIASFIGVETKLLPHIFLMFIGYLIVTSLSTLLLSLSKRIKSALCDTLFNFVTTLLIISLYFFNGITIVSVFTTYLVSSLIVFICFVWQIDSKMIFPLTFNKEHLNKIFVFTKWTFLGVTAGYFINWGDNLVLRLLGVNLDNIGIYNFAYQISKTLLFISGTFNYYFLPFLSEHSKNKEKLLAFFYVKRPKIILFCTACLGVAFFVIPLLVQIIFESTYNEAILIFRILLISNLLHMYSVFYRCLFDSLEKYRVVNIVSFLQIVLNIALNFILIPIYGIIGAAISTVIAYVLRALLLEIYFRKYVIQEIKCD